MQNQHIAEQMVSVQLILSSDFQTFRKDFFLIKNAFIFIIIILESINSISNLVEFERAMDTLGVFIFFLPFFKRET